MKTKHSPEFKAKLVLEVLKGEQTLSEIASEYNLHPTLLTRWKAEAVKNMPQVFENGNKALRQQSKQHEAQVEELYKQIGRLSTQNEWLKKKSGL